MPVAIPASSAAKSASQTFAPEPNNTTKTAPPVQNDPSTVRSAISRIWYVIYTPIAMIPQINPWDMAPGSVPIKEIIGISSSI